MDDFHAMRSGRTCRALSPHTRVEISPLCSPVSYVSHNRKHPIFVSLTRGGPKQVSSWHADARLAGVYSMHNTSEYPNDAAESSLSQILQANVPATYFLSPRACQGILNRAARKNKAMPPILHDALTAVAEQSPPIPG